MGEVIKEVGKQHRARKVGILLKMPDAMSVTDFTRKTTGRNEKQSIHDLIVRHKTQNIMRGAI